MIIFIKALRILIFKEVIKILPNQYNLLRTYKILNKIYSVKKIN